MGFLTRLARRARAAGGAPTSGRSSPTLEAAVEFARQGHQQPAIEWPRDAWLKAFPDHKRLFRSFPDELGRNDVRRVFGKQSHNADGAVNCFLAAMAWGYGRTGYGAFRTQRVLSERGAADALAEAREHVRRKGPLDGYRLLSGRHRITNLGPAFGTKFLYFENSEALILDRLIAGWYEETLGVDLRASAWEPAMYAGYLATMGEWSDKARLRPDQLEEAIFTLVASTRKGSQWKAEDDD